MTNCIEIHWTDHSRYVTRKNWFVWVDFQQPALKPYLYFIKPSFKQNWTRLWLIDHLISGEEAPDRHTACLRSGVSAREESADMEAPARGDSGPSSMMWTSSGRIGEAAMIGQCQKCHGTVITHEDCVNCSPLNRDDYCGAIIWVFALIGLWTVGKFLWEYGTR